MAEWRKVAIRLALADGKIDDAETKIIKKALFADGKIDKEELEFLQEIRNKAKSVAPAFRKLFASAVKSHVLADGSISNAEAAWLRKAIFADKKIDADEKLLLKQLRAGAKSTSPDFDKLCKACGV